MTHETHICTSHDIAAYVDGELSPAREMQLEMHFASCSECTAELNLQKNLLNHLEFGLKSNADIELPADFAKVVVANAESTVAGLRRPRERFNALFICGGLGLFLLMVFGVGAAASVLDQLKAVGSFFGHFAYDILLGVVVIIRGTAAQVRPELASALLMAGAFGISIYLARKAALRWLRS
ncbi:MAG TPA: zf-HC2 domain-containing protein [Pyrinomonadaceae bacterium]|nr:zf-HC2 domain-containing protein [Pyrinomonadaceae bacterium]